MPFTPSHAVVALPFVRTPLVPAAVAIGAMTPDLPLFVRGAVPAYAVTHDPVWILVTAAIALGLLVLWRCALRPAVRELSPRFVAMRLPRAWDGGAVAGWRETFRPGWGALALAASLLIGVASHILWDLLTHEGRWGVEAFPVLDEQWGPLLGYKWLQHGSSAVGLGIIAVWAALQLRARRPDAASVQRVLPGWVRVAWWCSLPLALAVAWGSGLVVHGPLDADFTVAHLAYRVLPPACAIWGAVTLALALAVQLRRRRLSDVFASDQRDTPGIRP